MTRHLQKELKFLRATMTLALLMLTTATVWAQEAPTNGYCGTDNPNTTDVDESKTVTWNYDTDTKTITIAGSGPMMYYNSVQNGENWNNGAPWRAFANEVEHVVIEDGITYVGSNTFAHCPNISNVTLPTDQHLYEIGPGAFGDCTSLTSIDIPMSVNNIGNGAFAGCSNLATVQIGYGDGANFTIGTDVFPATTTIIVPDVALQSYYNATSWASYKTQLAVLGLCGKTEEDLVTWMLISNGSVMVDLYGQDENSNLVKTGETTVPAYKLTISGTGAMADYTNSDDAPWMVLNQEIDNSQPASFFEDKKFITELEIGAGVSTLGANAFTGLRNLTLLTIANGSALTTIAPSDFAGNLTTVSLPTTVKTIDLKNDPMVLDYAINYAAWHAYHERFSTVGGYCGTTADNADGHNLSWTLEWKGEDADDNGHYPLTLTIEGTGAMADYTITNAAPWSIVADVLSLPEGLTYIGTYAFTNCNFATVTIPASVTYINDRAFERGAKAVTFAENSQLKTLYGETFQYCDLTSVTIPASVTTIGAAFENCIKIEHVTFAEGTEPLVMGETFCSCTSLETIDIPARVTNIINGAFNGCINLKTVTMLGDTPPTLGESTSNGTDPFAYCTSLSVILVPNENAYAAYKSAPTWNGTATGTKDNKTNYAHLLAPAAITLDGNTSGWNTYCHKYIVSYQVEDGAAYTVSSVSDNTVQTAAAEHVAPYTPTLVYKENGGVVTLTAIAETATQYVPDNYNATTGLVTKTETDFSMLGAAKDAPVSGSITAGYSYALFDGEFLKIDDSTLSIPAHRCILTLPEPLSASRLSIGDGTQTGIGHTEITEITERTGAWYTLDGRKLDKQPTTKGLYIYKGKKVVIK